ncbi:PERM1 protein, partial [Malurus elegans]|nr:PERM1 protein [Malurus elegans]
MDNFEYSIQLNDREWAEFLRASEECSLAPASLATADEQCLSDIEQGDASGRDCPSATGGEPAPGTGSPAPRGVPGDIGDTDSDTAPRHLAPPELLSGSEDEAELGSVGRFLCDSDKPGSLSPAAMPSAQRRQPPRPPAATPAGGTAQGSPGQDTEKGAAGGGQDTESQGGDVRGGQTPGGTVVAPPAVLASPGVVAPPGVVASPGVVAPPGVGAPPGSPAPSAPPEGSAAKSSAGASPTEPRLRGAAGDPPSPAPGTAQEEPSTPGGSPSVVRPKVPAQPRKSRRQRGASAAEGDRDPAGAAAGAGKAPPSSPMSSRKGKAKEKAAKAALVRLGSEEAAEGKRAGVSAGPDGGEPLKPRGKEPGAQSPGKTKATKSPKAGQAGGSGVRDSAPAVAAPGEPIPSAELPRIPAIEIPTFPGAEIPRIPSAELPRIPAIEIPTFPGAGIPWEAAAELPRARSPLCFAEGASGTPNSLDVTWPEMYDYLFCDSQEEDELGSSLEGRKSPLHKEFSWPELYEYFFNEPEGKRKKGKGKDRKRKKFGGLDRAGMEKEDPSSAQGKDSVFIPVPDVYGHFYPERAQNRMGWRGIFSTAPASEVKKVVGALKALLQRQVQLGGGQTPAGSQALVPRGSGDKLALVPLGGAQAWPEDADTALALRGKSQIPLSFHKDMCLVFCAFASWAVKTSDLQAPDAWKTMFLAGFGSLSAIRYFRRQVREGHPRT